MRDITVLLDYINTNGVDKLNEEFGIVVKKYQTTDPTVQYVKLNYDQISSPKNHHIADICRGLIVAIIDNAPCKVVARSFDRFYNLGESGSTNFNFDNGVVFEKCDGSLVLCWFDIVEQKWQISTRGMAFAEGNFAFSLVASEGTFRDWILKAMKLTEDEFQNAMKGLPTNKTYVMEYISTENLIVTRYSEAMMVLLSVIDIDTNTEENINDWIGDLQHVMNIRLPKTYPTSNSDELVRMCNELTDLQEGFVVYDPVVGNRVKIKSIAYLKAHKIRGNGIPSMNDVMELVLTGEQDEFLAYFPEFDQYFQPVENSLRCLINNAIAVFINAKHIEPQKEFALSVKDTNVAAICFKARKENTDALTAFNSMELNQQMKLLEKFL